MSLPESGHLPVWWVAGSSPAMTAEGSDASPSRFGRSDSIRTHLALENGRPGRRGQTYAQSMTMTS
jgi:hypothetical protein